MIIVQVNVDITTIATSDSKVININYDSVLSFSIDRMDTIREKDIQVVKGYVRNTLLTTLNEGQTAILQYLLLSNPACYSKDTVLVQSPYLPSLEFEFQKQGKPTISIIVSNIDKSWQMLVNGEMLCSNPIRQFVTFCNNIHMTQVSQSLFNGINPKIWDFIFSCQKLRKG